MNTGELSWPGLPWTREVLSGLKAERGGLEIERPSRTDIMGGMKQDVLKVLLTRDQIARRVGQLADQIRDRYVDLPEGLVIVPILSGSMVFVSDLIRQLPLRMRIGLLDVSSYPGQATVSQGPTIVRSLDVDVRGRHVLVVDDILDSGRTLRRVTTELAAHGPASVRTCVLLRKPAKAPPDLTPDYVGFDVDDLFVVGYGLDYDDMYRNWPEIVVLRPECYASPGGR